MKYLYKNEDNFIVEKQLGYKEQYCKVLKSAIEKYGLLKNRKKYVNLLFKIYRY